MQTLSSAGLVALWERGFGLHPLDQGLLALSVALPDVPPETLADWPLGQKNRALIKLHCTCFNPCLQAWASCDRCGEKMEFELEAEALVGRELEEHPGVREPITVKGCSFRLPTSRDLALASQESDPGAAALSLIERCRVAAAEPPAWSDDDLEEVEQAMAVADPLAEIRVSLRCPACHSEWDEAVDLATFLWAEIDARAKRLLWETHTLASAYGWSQGEILSLSSACRALYIQMVQA